MKRFIFTFAAVLAVQALSTQSWGQQAQIIQTPTGPVVVQGGGGYGGGLPQVYPQVGPPVQPQGMIYDRIHGGYVTPNQATGINPHTGGVDTSNQQINDTAFQQGRHQSQYNGTRRWERQPVYGADGRVIGYQEGYVWNNTLTGQKHGSLKVYTPNQHGGMNTQSLEVQGKYDPSAPRPKL